MSVPADHESSERSAATGWILVGIQGLLFAAIAFWPAAWSPTITAYTWPALVLLAIGAAGGVASALHLGRALTPHPQPNGAGLVARGIYRWARHPMYTALVIICGGVALGRGVIVSWALVVALIAFFDIKSRFEERYLLSVYDGYAEYAARTGKFLPGLAPRRAATKAD